MVNPTQSTPPDSFLWPEFKGSIEAKKRPDRFIKVIVINSKDKTYTSKVVPSLPSRIERYIEFNIPQNGWTTSHIKIPLVKEYGRKVNLSLVECPQSAQDWIGAIFNDVVKGNQNFYAFLTDTQVFAPPLFSKV